MTASASTPWRHSPESLVAGSRDDAAQRFQEGDQVVATMAQNMGVKAIRVDTADRRYRAATTSQPSVNARSPPKKNGPPTGGP